MPSRLNIFFADLRSIRADLCDAVTHLLGYDVFISRDDRSLGFFSFERYPTSPGNWHVFGFGRQAMVSRLQRR